MKKLLFISTLILSTSAFAHHLPDPVFGDLVTTVKVGAYPDGEDDSGSAKALTIGLETKTCNQYVHCFSPYAIFLNNDRGNNAGVGVDYVYKMLKRSNDNFYIGGGPVVFQDPLSGEDAERINLHGMVGVQVYDFLLSFDVYGNTTNSSEGDTTYLINLGVQFK